MIKIVIDKDHIEQKISGHSNASGFFDSISVAKKVCSTIHNTVFVANNSTSTKTMSKTLFTNKILLTFKFNL